MIRNFLSIVFLLIFSRVLSQGGVRIKDNDLDNSKNLTFSSTIIGVDFYNPNLNFFIDGKMQYRLKKEIAWINASYKAAWADRFDEVSETSSAQEAVPVGGSKALKGYGLSAGYNFIKREDYKVARASFINNAGKRNIRLPVKSYRLYGAHAGFEYFRSILAQGSTISYSGTVVADFPRDTTLETGTATPMFHMNMISLGIHRQYVYHSVIELNSNGVLQDYKDKSTSMVYADFLIAPKIVFEDILIPLNGAAPNSNNTSSNYNNTPYNFYRVDINNSYKKIPIGGRIGWEQVRLGNVGTSFGAEFGFRPGIFGAGFNTYVLLKYGISFNFKAK